MDESKKFKGDIWIVIPVSCTNGSKNTFHVKPTLIAPFCRLKASFESRPSQHEDFSGVFIKTERWSWPSKSLSEKKHARAGNIQQMGRFQGFRLGFLGQRILLKRGQKTYRWTRWWWRTGAGRKSKPFRQSHLLFRPESQIHPKLST